MTPSDLEGPISLLQRAHVLDASRDGPVGRTMVAERADCSRSTAYRATNELTEQGLLERTNNGYRLTGAGEAMLDHARRFTEHVKGTNRLAPLLEYVDDSVFVRRVDLFTNAEIVSQDGASPYNIETRVKEIIDETHEQMCGMTTGLGSPALAETMIERIQAGAHVDWILPAEMYDRFNEQFGRLSDHADEEGQTTVFAHEEIPIDLAIYDETLVVLGFDHERGVLGAIAVTDDRTALQWARDIFDDCRLEAEQAESE